MLALKAEGWRQQGEAGARRQKLPAPPETRITGKLTGRGASRGVLDLEESGSVGGGHSGG